VLKFSSSCKQSFAFVSDQRGAHVQAGEQQHKKRNTVNDDANNDDANNDDANNENERKRGGVYAQAPPYLVTFDAASAAVGAWTRVCGPLLVRDAPSDASSSSAPTRPPDRQPHIIGDASIDRDGNIYVCPPARCCCCCCCCDVLNVLFVMCCRLMIRRRRLSVVLIRQRATFTRLARRTATTIQWYCFTVLLNNAYFTLALLGQCLCATSHSTRSGSSILFQFPRAVQSRFALRAGRHQFRRHCNYRYFIFGMLFLL
jgi:hypothetical protein